MNMQYKIIIGLLGLSLHPLFAGPQFSRLAWEATKTQQERLQEKKKRLQEQAKQAAAVKDRFAGDKRYENAKSVQDKLFLAAIHGDSDAIDFMFDTIPDLDIDKQHDEYGVTLTSLAKQFGHDELCARLIEDYGAQPAATISVTSTMEAEELFVRDMNQDERDGYMSFLIEHMPGDIMQHIQLALKYKANPLAKDEKQKTAIEYAQQRGFKDLELLLRKYASQEKAPNTQDTQAAARRADAMARQLIAAEDNKEKQKKNNQKKSPPTTSQKPKKRVTWDERSIAQQDAEKKRKAAEDARAIEQARAAQKLAAKRQADEEYDRQRDEYARAHGILVQAPHNNGAQQPVNGQKSTLDAGYQQGMADGVRARIKTEFEKCYKQRLDANKLAIKAQQPGVELDDVMLAKLSATSQQETANTLLCQGAQHADLALVTYCLQQGAEVNCISAKGNSPLALASLYKGNGIGTESGHVIDLLKKHGAELRVVGTTF